MPAGRAQIEPQVRSEIGASVAAVTDGIPTDALFNRTPPNGTLVVGVDGADTKLYVRHAGVWKGVVVA